MNVERNPARGKWWAWAGCLWGITASVSANVAHAYIRPEHAPATWEPQVGAIIAAAFWPITIFITVEVISRVQWPDGLTWKTDPVRRP